MSAHALDFAALILVDTNRTRVALAQSGAHLQLPAARPQASDGLADTDAPRISRERLGDDPGRAAAFQDAALRALYEELGHLIARPVPHQAGPVNGPCWGRIRQHRLGPDRRALTYLGRAIDRADGPARRHVRVFAASLAKVSNSIKRRGRADRLVWLEPTRAIEALADDSLAPFLEIAPAGLGGRPRPLWVRFRAGQRLETRL